MMYTKQNNLKLIMILTVIITLSFKIHSHRLIRIDFLCYIIKIYTLSFIILNFKNKFKMPRNRIFKTKQMLLVKV